MDNCSGEKIITVGTAIAFSIAQKCTPEEIAVLGSLFTVIGDQLSLLSITKESSNKNINKG